MAAKMGSGESESINEINITPFVDIVLVLLIIFMISTPAMIMRGARVNLPKVVNSEDMSHVTFKLMIMADGSLWLENRQVSVQAVEQAFKKLLANEVSGDAVISADAAVPHGKVMEIVDKLRSMGVSQIGFGTLGGASAKSKGR
jgi:biopolymer transport protein TolR